MSDLRTGDPPGTLPADPLSGLQQEKRLRYLQGHRLHIEVPDPSDGRLLHADHYPFGHPVLCSVLLRRESLHAVHHDQLRPREVHLRYPDPGSRRDRCRHDPHLLPLCCPSGTPNQEGRTVPDAGSRVRRCQTAPGLSGARGEADTSAFHKESSIAKKAIGATHMRAAPFHYAGFPDCFQKTVPSEKDFGKQCVYSLNVLFFLIYFQFLPENWNKSGNLKIKGAFRAFFPPDFQKACSGEKEFGKLIDNASFSPVFPSDFQKPLKSIHHTSLGSFACICRCSLEQSELAGLRIFLFSTNPALSKIILTLESEGTIFFGYILAYISRIFFGPMLYEQTLSLLILRPYLRRFDLDGYLVLLIVLEVLLYLFQKIGSSICILFFLKYHIFYKDG